MSECKLALVKINPNIVAMSGAIMPEPLAIPMMLISTPSILHVLITTLGKVSVVLIACAA